MVRKIFVRIIIISMSTFFITNLGWSAKSEAPYLATGVRVGQVSSNSSVVWCRLTEHVKPNPEYLPIPGWTKAQQRYIPVYAYPWESLGKAGRARVFYRAAGVERWSSSVWKQAEAINDFCLQFDLSNLKSGTKYQYYIETADITSKSKRSGKTQTFSTAPSPDQAVDVTFTARTGQRFDRREDSANGFYIYPAMGKIKPDFFIGMGDEIYYDAGDIIAMTRDEGRYKWHRIYSLPWMQDFFREIPTYLIKSDHDTWINDSSKFGQGRKHFKKAEPPTYKDTFSWEDGLKIWREQNPMSPLPYRTFRWGKHIQIWLTEYREYRDDNMKPDGPDKTLWGAEQIAWLKQSMLASDANFLLLINDSPMISKWYDKNDNHAEGFRYEGDAFMKWVIDNGLKDRFYIICGDKHWQHMFVDKNLKIAEFSVGTATDAHAVAYPVKDGYNPADNYFDRVGGGFLSVTATKFQDRPILIFKFHDVHGNEVFKFNTGTDRAKAGLE